MADPKNPSESLGQDWLALQEGWNEARSHLIRAADLLPNTSDVSADEARFLRFDESIEKNDLEQALEELKKLGMTPTAPREFHEASEQAAKYLERNQNLPVLLESGTPGKNRNQLRSAILIAILLVLLLMFLLFPENVLQHGNEGGT